VVEAVKEVSVLRREAVRVMMPSLRGLVTEMREEDWVGAEVEAESRVLRSMASSARARSRESRSSSTLVLRVWEVE
jgi:hypothetical protein